jgi:hypothetical protein
VSVVTDCAAGEHVWTAWTELPSRGVSGGVGRYRTCTALWCTAMDLEQRPAVIWERPSGEVVARLSAEWEELAPQLDEAGVPDPQRFLAVGMLIGLLRQRAEQGRL